MYKGFDKYQAEEKKNRRLSALATALFLALLVFLLFWAGMYYQDPPPPEDGVAVALGEPDAGMAEAFEAYTQSQPAPSAPEENLTQDTEEAPSAPENPPIKPTTTPNNVTTPTQPTTTPSTQPQTPVRTFSQQGRSGGEGDNNKEGQQGQPDGIKGGDPYGSGTGKEGSGIGTKRGVLRRHTGTANCNADGYVNVEFKVDRQGRVISAKAVLKGSSISDSECQKEAVANALKWTFEPDPNAPEVDTGLLPVYFQRQ